MPLGDLEGLVAAGDVDTVILAFTDMQGRLVGKRVPGRFFVDEVAAHGAECCSYLLAVDVDNNTVPGYAMSSWETGYGDMVMRPDFDTLRRVPWLPCTALVMADLACSDGSAVAAAPRTVLRGQLDRLSHRGWGAECRHRTRVHGVRRQLPRRVGRRLPRIDSGQRLQHRLRDTGVDADGAVAARHSARHGRRGPALSRPARASAIGASRRSGSATTTLWSPATTTPSTRTAPRKSPTSTARA